MKKEIKKILFEYNKEIQGLYWGLFLGWLIPLLIWVGLSFYFFMKYF